MSNSSFFLICMLNIIKNRFKQTASIITPIPPSIPIFPATAPTILGIIVAPKPPTVSKILKAAGYFKYFSHS